MAENTESTSSTQAPRKMGCGITIVICIIAFVLLGVGLNQALGYYYEHCTDREVFECFFNKVDEPENAGVLAKGTYTYKDYSADFTVYIPMEGGDVTGKVSGVCTGSIKGSYDGIDNGVITATMAGYCDPFFIKIPAKGSFSGTVQKSAKKVPIYFNGSGGGFEKEDSMELSF